MGQVIWIVVGTMAGYVIGTATGLGISVRRRRPCPECGAGERVPAGASAPAVKHIVEPDDLYPGLSSDYLLHPAPTVSTDGGEKINLRDWLRHNAQTDGVFPAVVKQFYEEAVRIPEVKDYFGTIASDADMARLQRHFVYQLVKITGEGVTVGMVRAMRRFHSQVRNSQGAPISVGIFDDTIMLLGRIMSAQGVPYDTIMQLATVVAPFRDAIAVHPEGAH